MDYWTIPSGPPRYCRLMRFLDWLVGSWPDSAQHFMYKQQCILAICDQICFALMVKRTQHAMLPSRPTLSASFHPCPPQSLPQSTPEPLRACLMTPPYLHQHGLGGSLVGTHWASGHLCKQLQQGDVFLIIVTGLMVEMCWPKPSIRLGCPSLKINFCIPWINI